MPKSTGNMNLKVDSSYAPFLWPQMDSLIKALPASQIQDHCGGRALQAD